MSTLEVRPAVIADLRAIVRLERLVWGKGVGADSAAPPALIRRRIELCNAVPPGWFWVVKSGRRVEGNFVLQPTAMPPEKCRSWDHATDEGELAGTFDPAGAFVYGVSLTMRPNAAPGAARLLANAIHLLRLEAGKEVLYACARMSGFGRAHARTDIDAEKYWQLTRRDGLPYDPFLRYFRELIGLRPVRLLRDGFPPDAESGGHGVLCMSDDPMRDALMSARRLLGAGQKAVLPERSKK